MVLGGISCALRVCLWWMRPASRCGVVCCPLHILALAVIFVCFLALWGGSAEGFRSESGSRSGYHERKCLVRGSLWGGAIRKSRSKEKKKVLTVVRMYKNSLSEVKAFAGGSVQRA